MYTDLSAAPAVPRSRLAEPRMLVLAAVFAALEGYDLACYGVTVPTLLADRSMVVTKTAAGTVGSLVAVGMMIGAAIAGALVNRLGAKRLLLTGAGTFSTGMLACALTPTFTVFGVARLIVGIGLGVVLPTLTTYVAEMSAASRRNRNVGRMMAGYAVGALLAPLLGATILPVASWRWIYVIGAIPGLLLLSLATRLLTTPPVQPREFRATRDLLGLRPLLSRGTLAATLLFWGMSFCGLLLVFGISTWLPSIMHTVGYSLSSSLLQTAAMWVGAGVGMIVGGRVGDKVGIKPVVVMAFVVGSLSLLAMSAHPALGLLFLLMFVSGLGFIGSQVLTNAFVVTRYPDDLRGPGIGWALAVGRLGAIVGPALGGWIMSSQLDVNWNFYLFAIPGVLGAILAACVPAMRRSV